MAKRNGIVRQGTRNINRLIERVRRSISEFLAIPILIVAAFFALALVLYVMDHDAGTAAHWGPVRSYLGRYVGDGASSTGLLTTIAGSLITVTSITFSILLLAVQQGASSLTSQIIDHYLRRPSNRMYFGFFVGTSVFALVTLVLTTGQSRPVLGVTFATLFAGLALFALVLLIYSTIDQIRPISIINAIHDATLVVRDRQEKWLPRTALRTGHAGGHPLTSDRSGYLARIDVAALERLAAANADLSIAITRSIGEFASCGATIATVHPAPDGALKAALRRALPIEEQRDVDCDAAFGVDHLVNIAWTTISTAKSNPAVGVVACHALGDILCRWAVDATIEDQRAVGAIAYRDTTLDQLFDGIETLVAATSESMQPQTLAVIMSVIGDAFERFGSEGRDRLEAILLTSLPALGDHLPTRAVELGFARLTALLRQDGRADAADRLDEAWATLAATRGQIKSRGNRA